MTTSPDSILLRSPGDTNLILLVPHGCSQGPADPHPIRMADLGTAVGKRLGGYTIINRRLRQRVIDLNDISQVCRHHRLTRDFLHCINAFREEITANGLKPQMFILLSAAADSIGHRTVLLGYGQGLRGDPERRHRPTMAPSRLSTLRIALEDQGLTTHLAPMNSRFCGRDPQCLNQLFRQKNFLQDMYHPQTPSLNLVLSDDLLTDPARSEKILALALADFCQPLPRVRRIRVDRIDNHNRQDQEFIFRLPHDARRADLLAQSYLDDLARSIDANGLLHPLILLPKQNGRYRILCGFRRFQAVSKLGKDWIEARIYKEEGLTKEQFFQISLAENTKRRNLNPVEIGHFLNAAAQELGINNRLLAEHFGASLGLGRPDQPVSQATISKYRKVHHIHQQGESSTLIHDLINEKISFTIVAEILAPISRAEDRDALYLEIIRPFQPTRAQVLTLVKLLENIHPRLEKAIRSPVVQKILKKARQDEVSGSQLIGLLENQLKGSKRRQEIIAAKADKLRIRFFGPDATQQDFSIKMGRKNRPDELALQIRLRKEGLEETLDQLRRLLADKKQLQELFSPD